MRISAALLLAGLVLLGCHQDQPAALESDAPTQIIRLVHTWAVDAEGPDQLRVVLNESLHGMQAELSRAVSETAMRMLQRDEIAGAFTYANMAYMTYPGQLEQGDPADHIRAIAELPIRAVQV